MKTLILLLTLAVAIPARATTIQCGLEPLPPLGCKRSDAQCICDPSGCRWVFVCGR